MTVTPLLDTDVIACHTHAHPASPFLQLLQACAMHLVDGDIRSWPDPYRSLFVIAIGVILVRTLLPYSATFTLVVSFWAAR